MHLIYTDDSIDTDDMSIPHAENLDGRENKSQYGRKIKVKKPIDYDDL